MTSRVFNDRRVTVVVILFRTRVHAQRCSLRAELSLPHVSFAGLQCARPKKTRGPICARRVYIFDINANRHDSTRLQQPFVRAARVACSGAAFVEWNKELSDIAG